MHKSKKSAGDIIKEILSHVVLIAIALIVLIPIFYLISAGFRTNQAIYGPLIDTNSWVDDTIAVKSENKVNAKILLNRLYWIYDGNMSDEEIAKVESVWTKSYKKNGQSINDDEVKNIINKYGAKVPSIPKKIVRSGDSQELTVLREATKKLILAKPTEISKNAKGNYEGAYGEFINAYNAWANTINDGLRSVVDEHLFQNGNLDKPRYKYEVRTSFYNFKCFFTGASPNAATAKYPYLRWVWNSIIIALAVAVIQLAVVALASYAISRFRFKGKKVSLMVILTVQVFPGTMSMVALYLLLQYLGVLVPALGIDRKLGLILIYLGGGIPFNIWLVKGYFDTIPKALEESAMIDGATYWQAFTMIILPLVRPILAVVTVLSFVGQYNEFVLASVILTSQNNFTLPVGLRFFVNAQQDARFGVFAACSIMGSLPIVVLWLALQNQIISGLTGGSVKG